MFKNYEELSCDFIHDNFKWWKCKEVNEYIKSNNAHNLPSINDLCVFVVYEYDNDIIINKEFVLLQTTIIDKKNAITEPIGSYTLSLQGHDELITEINIHKIDKHFSVNDEPNDKTVRIKTCGIKRYGK